MFIEPSIPKTNDTSNTKDIIIEANIPAASLNDLKGKYNISAERLVDLLDYYFSPFDLEAIEEYVANQVNENILEEDLDVSPSTLLDKVSDNDLKDMAKDAGVKLSGKESKDEIKGMVKVLAGATEAKKSTNEAGFSAEYIGGYKADIYVKLAEKVDIDAYSNEIRDILSQNLSKGVVEEVLISELPKNLFESKKLSKFAR